MYMKNHIYLYLIYKPLTFVIFTLFSENLIHKKYINF